MPVTYRFDLPNRLAFSYAWGTLTGPELVAHSRRIQADPRFEPGFRQLQLLSDVDAVAVTTEELRLVAGLNPWGAGSRRAVVVATRQDFDLARQHELLRMQPADELRVFQDLAAALAWLGLPAGWVPPAPAPDDPVFDFPPDAAAPGQRED